MEGLAWQTLIKIVSIFRLSSELREKDEKRAGLEAHPCCGFAGGLVGGFATAGAGLGSGADRGFYGMPREAFGFIRWVEGGCSENFGLSVGGCFYNISF